MPKYVLVTSINYYLPSGIPYSPLKLHAQPMCIYLVAGRVSYGSRGYLNPGTPADTNYFVVI